MDIQLATNSTGPARLSTGNNGNGAAAPSRGRGAFRGGRGGRGGARGGRGGRVEKSAAELDADLDSYNKMQTD